MAGVSAAYLAADGFTGAPAVTVCDPAVADVAGAFTPVPGGVGPVTVAMLLRNTLRAAGCEV